MQTDLFYNTTNQTGKKLKKAVTRANSLQTIVLDFFKANPDSNYTPFEVQKAMNKYRTPITSFRRCITNLTNANEIRRTNIRRTGEYGVENYCWKLI